MRGVHWHGHGGARYDGQDIKDRAVTGKDIKKRTLGTKKLTKSAVASLTGERGPG